MFGSGKTKDVRLTEKQIRELTRNMSGSERRQFNKVQKELVRKQRRVEDDAFWNGMLLGSLFFDD